MVRASIIIPALNEAENLARNLPEVVSQLGPHDEVVVVDNGSDDGTADISARLGAIVVHEPIRDRSRARNKGIESARGDIAVFLDADCRPSPQWLQCLLLPFENPEVGCVAGEILIHYSDNKLGEYLKSKGHLSQHVNFGHPFLPYGGSGNVAFRTEVLHQIGGFDEALFSGHDADICWRMQLQTNYRIVLASDALVDHFQQLTFPALVRQKRRHAYGAVLLYKKYRSLRKSERRSLKHIYWEYRSIVRRGTGFLARKIGLRLGLCSAAPIDQGYQLLLEFSEKIGRIEGSIGQRVWFL